MVPEKNNDPLSLNITLEKISKIETILFYFIVIKCIKVKCGRKICIHKELICKNVSFV